MSAGPSLYCRHTLKEPIIKQFLPPKYYRLFPYCVTLYTSETLGDFRSSPELVVLTQYCLPFRTKELHLTVTVRGFTRPGMIIWWALRRKRRPNWRTTPQGDLWDQVVLSMYWDHNKYFGRLGYQFDRFMLSPEVFAWLHLRFCFFIYRITVDKYRGYHLWYHARQRV